MRTYEFTPELLDALPENLAELFRSLESTLLDEICTRLSFKKQLNEVTIQAIRALRSHGIETKDIKKAIKRTANISDKKLDELISDVVERNQAYYTELIDFAGLTQPEVLVNTAVIDAIRRQTREECHNITQSMGFLVDNGRTMLAPAKAYQWALDNAELQIESGAVSYNQAIKNAVKQLAGSGLKTVNYESGHVDQVDVAIRRAVMTGVNQVCDQYTNQSAEYLGTRYFQVSAHLGARDKAGVSPWSSHKDWQGKVYYQSENGEADPRGEFKDLVETTGYGYADGLTGANCRHRKSPFIPDVMERTYTDEQLEHIDDGLGCDFDGKHYTAYEATQMQRRMERTIRKQRRLRDVYKAAGLEEDAQAANIKLRRLNAKYKEFSEESGLPEQRERLKVYKNEQKNIFTSSDSRRIMNAESGGGHVTINNIERPIEQRNTGKGNPNAILHFDVDLNNRQEKILDALPNFDSRIVISKNNVSMIDLAALTAKTGDEFALFTKSGERMVVRGNSAMVAITPEEARTLGEDGYNWSGHTHPGIDMNSLQPSSGDYAILNQFDQQQSLIYNSAGQYLVFERTEPYV